METRTLRVRTLRTAIFASIGIAALAAQGCDDGGGTGGAGGASSSTGASTTGKGSSSSVGSTSGNGSTTSAATTNASSTSDASSSTGGGMKNVERCFPDGGSPCATLEKAGVTYGECTFDGEKVLAWISGPTQKAAECCYQVDVSDPGDPTCGVVGRPLVVEAAPRKAAIASTDSGWLARSLAPSVEALDEAARLALSEAWSRDASFEHASVAAFSKTALELMALGAPRELVEGCHRAALDEIEHASIGFALASAYAGARVSPGQFPDALRVDFARTLEDVAVAAVHEGCVGETLAALVAAAQRDAALDPSVKAALIQIAADEARHAELSYQIVAWALREGGASVRAAVESAFDAAIATERAGIEAAERAAAADDDDVLAEHGRIATREIAREKSRGLEEVVLPSMKALLG